MRKRSRATVVSFIGAAIAAAALALAGCSGSTSSGSTSSGSSSGELSGTLNVSWLTAQQPAMATLITRFEKAHPSVKINAAYLAVSAYQASLRTKLNSGTAPDVFFLWLGNGNPGAQLQFSPDGYLADLSSSPWVSDVPKSEIGNAEYQGKVYAMPLQEEGMGMAFNLSALKATGQSVPTTWTGLLNFCQKVNAQGKIPISLPAATTQYALNIVYPLAAGLVYGPNPDFDSQQAAGKVTFSSSAGWQKAWNQLEQMKTNHCFGSNAAGTTPDEQGTEIGTGQAISAVSATGTLSSFTSAYPSLKLGLYPMPVSDNPADNSYLEDGLVASAGVNAKSHNLALAKAFLDFIAQPANDVTYANDSFAVPVFPPAGYTPPAELKILVTTQQADKNVDFLDAAWPNPSVQNALGVGVQQIIGGTGTTASVLSAMDAAYKQGS
jgi:raffinose/stachyose/melibiose transport system substrate-binding protein